MNPAIHEPGQEDTADADPINWWAPERQEGVQRVWLRTSAPLPDVATMPNGLSYFDEEMQIASLDHAMWFHRIFRGDEWLLYVSESPSSSNSRGIARGSIFDHAGRLVASVAQEGLMRKR